MLVGQEQPVDVGGVDAAAGVEHLDAHASLRGSVHHLQPHRTLAGVLAGVRQQVRNSLPNAIVVTADETQPSGHGGTGNLHPGVGGVAGQRHGVGDDGLQVDVVVAHPQAADLQLGDVEQVVDDASQHRGLTEQCVGRLAEFARKVGVPNELAEAQHAVQRVPQLVAHLGDEVLSLMQCHLGVASPAIEFVLDGLAVVDVPDRHHQRGHVRVVETVHAVQLQPCGAAVAAPGANSAHASVPGPPVSNSASAAPATSRSSGCTTSISDASVQNSGSYPRSAR